MPGPGGTQHITFGDAIGRGFSRYAQFHGRASRAEFWWWFLFTVLAGLVASTLDNAINGDGVVGLLLLLVLICPDLAVSVRRLHDTDRSGWWILIGLVPFVGVIVLLVLYVLPGTPGHNHHGPPPT